MFSNVPSMLQQQDFQASNRDMLEAARGGKTLAEAPKYVRGLCAAGERLADIKYDRRLDIWSVNWATSELERRAKIGAQLRVRIPNNYSIIDLPGRINKIDAVAAKDRVWLMCDVGEAIECSPESPIPPPSSRD